MVDTIKELCVKFQDYHAVTLLDEHGDRWVTVPSMVISLGMESFETDFPVEMRLSANEAVPVIPVSMISKLIPTKKAAVLQGKLEAEWLFFFGYVKGPKGEGASRKANRESLHMLKKSIRLVSLLREKHGLDKIDIDKYLEDSLYRELLGIMGYAQPVDWEDLSQWELQNLTFVQNAFSSSILLYLSQEEMHDLIKPEECLTVLLQRLRWDMSKTMNSMFMAQELSVKLGEVAEFQGEY